MLLVVLCKDIESAALTTVCPISLEPFSKVRYSTKWVKTFWIYSKIDVTQMTTKVLFKARGKVVSKWACIVWKNSLQSVGRKPLAALF